MLENLRRRALRLPACPSTCSQGCALGPASALPQVLDGKPAALPSGDRQRGIRAPLGPGFSRQPATGHDGKSRTSIMNAASGILPRNEPSSGPEPAQDLDRGITLQPADSPASDVECRRCGACCAAFRVSFYWAEADASGLSPILVEQIGPWYACMTGTNSAAPHCLALTGTVGSNVLCSVYAQRPSPCRKLRPGDSQCARARDRYGLPAIVAVAEGDPSCASGG